MRKYKNTKVEVDDITFDSKREARRYRQLKLLEKNGDIADLELQPKFTLLEGYTTGQGKRIRKMEYWADFKYIQGGQTIVEDTKGFKTKDYMLKKKLFEKVYYPLTIREV